MQATCENVNSKLNKCFSHKHFYEIYCILLSILTVLAWNYLYTVISTISIIIAIFMLLKLKDFKYVIPAIFCVVYGYGTGFNINDFPIPLIIVASILIVICAGYTIKNRRRIPINKNLVSFIGLTILCFIPILWNHNIKEGYEVLYFMSFAWLLYLVIYITFNSNLKRNSFDDISTAISYLGVVVALECIISYIVSMNTTGEYNFVYPPMMGWGIINECGIVMLFSAPFCFIKIVNSKCNRRIIVEFIKILTIILAIIITGSRGTYLFGSIEILLLMIFTAIYAKKKKIVLTFYILIVIVTIGLLSFQFDKIIEFFNNIFHDGMNDNGRFMLWEWAMDDFSKNIYTGLFGNGMVDRFISYGQSQTSSTGFDWVFVVYHSTFFETLAAFGIVGVILMFIHLIEKYYYTSKLSKPSMLILATGFLLVDLYGMIDNTYHMFYYMIPLVILLASLESIQTIDYKTNIFYKKVK